MIIIYISSPYSNGDVVQKQQELLANVQRAEDAEIQLIDAGFLVFNPLHSHYVHARHPRTYEKWLVYDMHWIKRCDAVLRLPGRSSGADREVIFAEAHDIPVFNNVEAILYAFRKEEKPSANH